MAFTNSLIGYSSDTLVDPSTANSLIGYSTDTLVNPAPVEGYSNSLIGYSVDTLISPHAPLGLWDGTAWKWVAPLAWDGSAWR